MKNLPKLPTMKKIRFFFLLFVFSPFLLLASPYDMILTGDPILDDARYLSLESGNAFLSFTPPLSPGELEIFLNGIDISTLSKPAGEAYWRIKKRLSPETPLSISTDNFSLLFNINATLEARTRFNTDISWHPLYPKIPPALSLPLRLCFSNIVQLYFEPLISADPEYYREAENFGVNVPYRADHFDLNLPLRAFIAAGGSWWNFQLGRDRLSYGSGYMGNLAVSDNSAFYEYARLSLFSRFLKYSVLTSQMPLEITDDFYEIQNPESLSQTTQRHFYLHRLDFSLFDVFSIGIMEGIMAGNSPLELRFLNPMMIFHSFFSWWDYDYWPEPQDGNEIDRHMNGSIFSIEANWNIVKSLALYGQFVMNEYSTSHELGIASDQPPNGLGYLAGLRFSHSFEKWGSQFILEFIRADPYLYMTSSPFSSFIQMRKLAFSSERIDYYYIGFPRDTIALTVGAKLFKDDILLFTTDFSWFSKGEHSINWDWKKNPEAFAEETPSGIAENKFILSLDTRWKINRFLVFNGGIAGIVSRNNKNESGSNEVGGQAAFSVGFTY